jgi:uncharacterized protein (DUF1778 family)
VTLLQRRSETSKAARLNVRLNLEVKEKIEQAAAISHQTISDFVVTTLLHVSEDTLRRQQTIHLTNRDRDRFLAALDEQVGPNPALRKAAGKFKRKSRKSREFR